MKKPPDSRHLHKNFFDPCQGDRQGVVLADEQRTNLQMQDKMSQYELTAAIPASGAREQSNEAHPAMMTEEARLFAKFLGGDDIAAIRIFKMYNDRLFVYCTKVLGDREQAQDLAQSIWERVIRLRNDPPQVANPTGFLFRIARNLCLNHLRLRKQYDALPEVDDHRHPSVVMEGEEHSELEGMVLASLDELSFDYREVLILNIYCGYRFDEIAEMLGKTPDAIWARASRARAQLRKVVQNMMKNDSRTTSNGADAQ
jgi:RNA polymerase sigma-70 factor (ECF subfamily)